MTNKKHSARGMSLIKALILVFILILVLSYFKISIKSVVESPESQSNISYVTGAGKNLWNDHLKEPTAYLWNNIVIDIFWKSFINNMERIRDGEKTDLENLAPTFPTGVTDKAKAN
ncbi:MAG TPA: hypothetical protein PKZ36_00005 [Candidatus Paceibacterota bacterium]|nr:hypothetical protein [Candidatus Paceibacterota bacterium]HPT17787.1 hypothetical protein [Candidatus Paceibacterota bacterium]